MDDKHVQERGGVLPAPPPRTLPGHQSPEVCSASAGFTSLENLRVWTKQQKLQVSDEIPIFLHSVTLS